MAVLFGVLVGLALGLTGGGGSILALPFLIYGLDVAPKSAVVLSLAVVGLTALFGAFSAWRGRLLERRAALIFAVGGVIAAPVGMTLGSRLDDTVLIIAFAALTLLVAIRMFFSAWRHPEQSSVVRGDFESGSQNDAGTICHYSLDGRLHMTAPCGMALVALGLLTGLLSGLFGVGGGFVIVPALVMVTEMGIHRAVATSLMVIAVIGVSGVLSALAAARDIDWSLGLLFLAGGLLGMFLGRSFAHRLAGPRLQQLFAVMMVAVAGYMLLDQWPV